MTGIIPAVNRSSKCRKNPFHFAFDNQEAWEILDAIYSWFSEGFETLDLVDARALLVELASID
jgi:hypothetical protein